MTNETMKEKLVAVANLLADLTGAVAEIAAEFGEVKTVKPAAEEKLPSVAEEKTPPAMEEKNLPSLEEVRAVLADISRSGKTAEMKALLGKFGASRLSEVKAEDYTALLAAAKEVSNA